MITLNGMLDLGRRALYSNQIALAVIGHNTANVNTLGYSRQRAQLSPSMSLPTVLGAIGTGVNVLGIQQIHDSLLDRNIRDGYSNTAQWQAIDGSLQTLENIFGDVTDTSGLSDLLSDFWNGWQDVANDPENLTSRADLRQTGESMCSEFNRIFNSLMSEQQDLDQELQVRVGEINTLASAVANLNEQIAEIEGAGGQANDLRDQRVSLLNNLSGLVDTQVSEGSNGQVNVYIGGQILVQDNLSVAITTVERSIPGGSVHDLVWSDGGASVDVSGGQIAGLIEMRDERIPEVVDRMDELANAMVLQVNSLHQAGYGLNGASGNDFFNPESSGAGNMSLSGAVLDSLEVIAASGSGAPGDNSNALAIAGLQNELLMENGTATIGDYFANMVSEVGVVRQNSTFRCNQEEATLYQLENQRESISGVNLDEEMTNLIQYQQAYEAAARLVNTVSQMMDTVLNLV